jgi:hypothetical protein
MSISLKVVSSAALCCDCTRRSAIFLRNGLIGTTSSGLSPAAPPLASARGVARITSSFNTRPPGPEASTSLA